MSMRDGTSPQTVPAKWLRILGPGIMFASACIGVSHLVQSTRAGAMAGYGLLWAILAANAAKYPFFELSLIHI